ncbi:hypothetical protein BC938DRAFT_472742 [Jimgerdemannia flammicorona]|uniref:Methyltransferase type 11 domain-containing protein n=1 Tax=Jimgerdemannia flammicorona TaxID=994334 RepID=A0A433Q5G3_9FUNG|nr:hypothetical protein BC938DRAFT_472742 [Jimgerdemannia flammicorona]
MLMSFSVREWNIAINELMRVLKPGGFLELVESDLRIYDAGPATAQWNRTLYKVMRDRDFSPRTARHLPDLLLRHGTRNVHGEHRSCPMNWLGRLGQLMFEDMELAFEALKTPMLRSGSYTDVLSYDRSVDMARGEFANFKSWVNFYAAYGMKPL